MHNFEFRTIFNNIPTFPPVVCFDFGSIPCLCLKLVQTNNNNEITECDCMHISVFCGDGQKMYAETRKEEGINNNNEIIR